MFGSMSNWDDDIFDHFDRLQREVGRLWPGSGRPANIRAVARGSYPAINVGATADSIHVYVFAPGLDREKLDLSVRQNLLSISGEVTKEQPDNTRVYLSERFSGRFQRAVTLPEDADPDSAKADYRNGVLHITLHRKGEAKPRKIEISV